MKNDVLSNPTAEGNRASGFTCKENGVTSAIWLEAERRLLAGGWSLIGVHLFKRGHQNFELTSRDVLRVLPDGGVIAPFSEVAK